MRESFLILVPCQTQYQESNSFLSWKSACLDEDWWFWGILLLPLTGLFLLTFQGGWEDLSQQPSASSLIFDLWRKQATAYSTAGTICFQEILRNRHIIHYQVASNLWSKVYFWAVPLFKPDEGEMKMEISAKWMREGQLSQSRASQPKNEKTLRLSEIWSNF